MISITLILVIGIAAVVWYLLNRPNLKNLPPGPKGFPIVGNLLQLNRQPSVTYEKWAKEYGSIFHIKLLSTRAVVISDHKLLKEAFSETALSGRMDMSLFDVSGTGTTHGIFSTEGEQWEELRRFTLKQLRDFGFGKNSMEDSIMNEVNEMIEHLKKEEGRPVSNIREKFLLAVINSLWVIVTGKRYKHSDPFLMSHVRNITETLGDLMKSPAAALFMFTPRIFKLIPSSLSGYAKLRAIVDDGVSFVKPSIEDHRATYNEDFQRDFTDCFLREINSAKSPSSAFYGTKGEHNLLATLLDLFNAGTDTTASTLTWLILYLSKNPEIQKKLQDEIDNVTGKSRQCSLTDKPNMPYTEAVIAETHRYASIIGDVVAHRAVRDIEFKGYLIPKDSIIAPNVRFIHHNPKVWGDPENFRPERFLTNNGKTFVKHEALIAFSVGRRQCIGESLARDSLFLFSTNIFQRFSFRFDENGPDHGFEPEINFILSPKPFNVIITDRLS